MLWLLPFVYNVCKQSSWESGRVSKDIKKETTRKKTTSKCSILHAFVHQTIYINLTALSSSITVTKPILKTILFFSNTSKLQLRKRGTIKKKQKIVTKNGMASFSQSSHQTSTSVGEKSFHHWNVWYCSRSFLPLSHCANIDVSIYI